MKLNNKGFAISSIMYIILILAVILISVTLALLSSRKLVLDKIKQEVMQDIHPLCLLIDGQEKTIGAKYSCEVASGTKYNFYVLSHETDGTTNLIMDRNICSDGTLATEDNTCLVAWYAPSIDTSYGPETATEYLNQATSGWSNIKSLNIVYNDEGGHFTNFKLEGKSRLPYFSEVDYYNGSNGYLYENLDNADGYWIGDESTKPTNNISGIAGYWTLSSCTSADAYLVDFEGYVSINCISNCDYPGGVRPVINVKL